MEMLPDFDGKEIQQAGEIEAKELSSIRDDPKMIRVRIEWFVQKSQDILDRLFSELLESYKKDKKAASYCQKQYRCLNRTLTGIDTKNKSKGSPNWYRLIVLMGKIQAYRKALEKLVAKSKEK